jgi:hypothetical protein
MQEVTGLGKSQYRKPFQMPTPLQIKTRLEQLGIPVPTTKGGLERMCIYLGWPTQNPDGVALLKATGVEWVGKHVMAGAHPLAREMYAGMSGIVLAIAPRTPQMRREIARGNAKLGVEQPWKVSTLQAFIKWDCGKPNNWVALCNLKIID